MRIEGGRRELPPLPIGERVAAQRPGEGASSHAAKRKPGATERARLLRTNDTEPEYRLWGELRARRLNGHKFVRQIPLGPYVVDFLCRERRLVLELDGAQHSGSRADVRRDRWLNQQGYSVLRFWNHEVLQERRAVLETLLAVLEGEISAPSPGLRFAPATLSPVGRGGRRRPRAALDHPMPPPPLTSQPLIRAASVADLPACARIINDYIDATDWLPRVKSHEEIAGFFTPELLERRTVLVAEADGEILAYLSFSAEGRVHAIYVAPAFRGHGIGRMLLDHVKEQHPQQVELTVFEPNLAARRFYEREGFAEVPEGRDEGSEEGIPILLMRWRGSP